MIKVCWKKFPPFKIKMDFWPFLWFCQNHKNGQKSIFYFERWKFFSGNLNHLGRLKFFIFYTFWFNQKNEQNWKKLTFVHSPFFQFLAQQKGFLYFWQKPIFEPARAILLRRVWYQPFRLKFRVPYPPQ